LIDLILLRWQVIRITMGNTIVNIVI